MRQLPAGRLRPVPTPSAFSVSLAEDEFSSTVAIGGTFESPNVASFEAAMKAALRTQGHIVVDLRRCHSIDSTAMMFLQRYKRALAEHLTILVAETGSVRRLLEISGLARSLDIRATLPILGRTA